MEGEIKCACGNTIVILSGVEGRELEIRAENGRMEKKGDQLLIICGKCGKEAGKVNFYRQVPEKK